MNCGTKEVYHIADGLYLCDKCDETKWRLVQDIGTKEIFWKNIDLTLANEIIVD